MPVADEKFWGAIVQAVVQLAPTIIEAVSKDFQQPATTTAIQPAAVALGMPVGMDKAWYDAINHAFCKPLL